MKRQPGFTLIELTIVAAIMAVVAGLVIIRWSAFSTRQQTVENARRIGNVLSDYRERAQSEQSIYALVLDLDANRYSIFHPIEKSISAIQNAQPLKSGFLTDPVHFGKVLQDGQTLSSPVVMFLDGTGILPNIQIQILSGQHGIIVLPDPVANENSYHETE